MKADPLAWLRGKEQTDRPVVVAIMGVIDPSPLSSPPGTRCKLLAEVARQDHLFPRLLKKTPKPRARIAPQLA